MTKLRMVGTGVACGGLLLLSAVAIAAPAVEWNIERGEIKRRPLRVYAPSPLDYRPPASATPAGRVATVVREALILTSKGDAKGLTTLHDGADAAAARRFGAQWRQPLVNWVVEFSHIGVSKDEKTAFVHIKGNQARSRDAYKQSIDAVIFLKRVGNSWLITPDVLDSTIKGRLTKDRGQKGRTAKPPSADPFAPATKD